MESYLNADVQKQLGGEESGFNWLNLLASLIIWLSK